MKQPNKMIKKTNLNKLGSAIYDNKKVRKWTNSQIQKLGSDVFNHIIATKQTANDLNQFKKDYKNLIKNKDMKNQNLYNKKMMSFINKYTNGIAINAKGDYELITRKVISNKDTSLNLNVDEKFFKFGIKSGFNVNLKNASETLYKQKYVYTNKSILPENYEDLLDTNKLSLRFGGDIEEVIEGMGGFIVAWTNYRDKVQNWINQGYIMDIVQENDFNSIIRNITKKQENEIKGQIKNKLRKVRK